MFETKPSKQKGRYSQQDGIVATVPNCYGFFTLTFSSSAANRPAQLDHPCTKQQLLDAHRRPIAQELYLSQREKEPGLA